MATSSCMMIVGWGLQVRYHAHEEGGTSETEPGVTGSNRNRTASETSATGTGAASGEASSTRERKISNN